MGSSDKAGTNYGGAICEASENFVFAGTLRRP